MPRDFEFGRLGQRTSFLFGISSWPIDVDDGGDKKPTTFAKNPPPEASPYPKDLNRSRQTHDPPTTMSWFTMFPTESFSSIMPPAKFKRPLHPRRCALINTVNHHLVVTQTAKKASTALRQCFSRKHPSGSLANATLVANLNNDPHAQGLAKAPLPSPRLPRQPQPRQELTRPRPRERRRMT